MIHLFDILRSSCRWQLILLLRDNLLSDKYNIFHALTDESSSLKKLNF